jgi:hypothetical protein
MKKRGMDTFAYRAQYDLGGSIVAGNVVCKERRVVALAHEVGAPIEAVAEGAEGVMGLGVIPMKKLVRGELAKPSLDGGLQMARGLCAPHPGCVEGRVDLSGSDGSSSIHTLGQSPSGEVTVS